MTAAQPGTGPLIELAIQRSSNPPAAWLWRPASEILGARLAVRVGGKFVWPPPSSSLSPTAHPPPPTRRVVFVTGGVGINPFVSMLSSMCEDGGAAVPMPESVVLLYSVKRGRGLADVLFIDRLAALFEHVDTAAGGGDDRLERRMQLHLTTAPGSDPHALPALEGKEDWLELRRQRIAQSDLERALGPAKDGSREGTAVYVCGPGPFVDQMVERCAEAQGMTREQVFFEKWW